MVDFKNIDDARADDLSFAGCKKFTEEFGDFHKMLRAKYFDSFRNANSVRFFTFEKWLIVQLHHFVFESTHIKAVMHAHYKFANSEFNGQHEGFDLYCEQELKKAIKENEERGLGLRTTHGITAPDLQSVAQIGEAPTS